MIESTSSFREAIRKSVTGKTLTESFADMPDTDLTEEDANSPPKVTYHVVVNATKKTNDGPAGTVVGKFKNLQRARNHVDKKDNEYGGHAHSIKKVEEDLSESSYHSHEFNYSSSVTQPTVTFSKYSHNDAHPETLSPAPASAKLAKHMQGQGYTIVRHKDNMFTAVHDTIGHIVRVKTDHENHYMTTHHHYTNEPDHINFYDDKSWSPRGSVVKIHEHILSEAGRSGLGTTGLNIPDIKRKLEVGAEAEKRDAVKKPLDPNSKDWAERNAAKIAADMKAAKENLAKVVPPKKKMWYEDAIVVHGEFGKGKALSTIGESEYIEVMFEHGIERVQIDTLVTEGAPYIRIDSTGYHVINAKGRVAQHFPKNLPGAKEKAQAWLKAHMVQLLKESYEPKINTAPGIRGGMANRYTYIVSGKDRKTISQHDDYGDADIVANSHTKKTGKDHFVHVRDNSTGKISFHEQLEESTDLDLKHDQVNSIRLSVRTNKVNKEYAAAKLKRLGLSPDEIARSLSEDTSEFEQLKARAIELGIIEDTDPEPNQHIVAQLKRAVDQGKINIKFKDGKIHEISSDVALKALKSHNGIQKPSERVGFAKRLYDSHDSFRNAIQ